MSWWDSAPVVEPVSASGPPASGGGKWWESAPAVESGEPRNSGESDSPNRLSGNRIRSALQSVGRPIEGQRENAPSSKTVPDAVQPFVGFNEVAANTLGAPVDAAAWITNKVARGAQMLTGEPRHDIVTDPVGGSGTFKKAMGLVGANPDDVALPTTTTGKVLRAAGEGVGGMVIPGMGAEALLAKTGSEVASFGNMLTNIIKGGGVASNTAVGAGSGAAGALVDEYVPEDTSVLGVPVKPLIKMGAEVGGGGTAALAENAVRSGAGLARKTVDPLFRSAEENAARNVLKEVPLEKQGEFRTELANVDASAPGNLTLFQATGNIAPKLGELERSAITKNPATAMEVRQGQNDAWLTQLTEMFNQDPRKALDFTRAGIKQVEDEHAAMVATARKEAESRAGQTGGSMFDDRSDYGKALQDRLDDLNAQKKAVENKLWDDFRTVAGNKPLPFEEAKPRIKAIAEDRGQFDAPIEGKEARIFDSIQNGGDFATFKDLTKLQGRLKEIIRDPQESGETRYRMREVLKVIDDTMDQAVDRVVIDGKRPLTEAMDSALTPDDVAAYGLARAATRERKETFGEGAVGKVLETGNRQGTFGTTESNVVGTLLTRPESIRDFIKAAGGDKTALDIAQDALAFDMRRKATVDGVISPEKLQTWVQNNTEAMKQFPELQAKFSNARTASETLDAAIAKQTEVMHSDQMKAAQRFIGDRDPHATLSEMMQRPDELRTLVDQIKQDPEAYAGLKRLAVELLLRRGKVIAEEGALEGAKEAGTSGKPQLALNAMQTFWYNNRRGFGQILDKSEMENIGSVMGQIQKAARTEGGVRIPGQSNSAQDLWSMTKDAIKSGWQKAGTAVGMTSGVASMDPYIGAPTVAAGIALDAWRTAYRGRMDAALTDIMLDSRRAQIAIPKLIAKVEGKQADMDYGRDIPRKLRALLGQEVFQHLEGNEQRSP